MIEHVFILHGVAGVGKGHIANKIASDMTFARSIAKIPLDSTFKSIPFSTVLKRDVMYLMHIENIELFDTFKVDVSNIVHIKIDVLYTLLKQMYNVKYSNELLFNIQRIFKMGGGSVIKVSARSLLQGYADLLKLVTRESIFADGAIDEILKIDNDDSIVIVIDDLRYYVEAETITNYCIKNNIEYTMCNVYGNDGYNLPKHSSEFMLDSIIFDKYIFNTKADIRVGNIKEKV